MPFIRDSLSLIWDASYVRRVYFSSFKRSKRKPQGLMKQREKTAVTISISTGQYQSSSGLLGRLRNYRSIQHICSTTMVFYEKICLKESETWRKCFSNKILSRRISHNFAFLFFTPSCCIRLLSLSLTPSSGISIPTRKHQVVLGTA